MNSAQLQQILSEAFPQSEINVSGEAGKFDLRVVDDMFEGKRTVSRQQQIYAVIQKYIADGSVHAVNMRLMTEEEWRKAKLFGA